MTDRAFPHELAAAIDGGPKELDSYLELREGSDIIRDIKALTNYKTPVAVELRDYFAVHATEYDLTGYMPLTCGEMLDLADRLGLATVGNSIPGLNAWARYQFADAMLRERERKPNV